MNDSAEEQASNPVLRLLRSQYRWLFLGNLANAIGAELRVMAQAWLILELGGSQADVGAATGLRFIPFLLGSLAAGVLIDRVGGRTILLWDRLGLLLIAVATAALVSSGVAEVVHIVAMSVAVGGILALGTPAAWTLVAGLVPREGRQTANALNTFTFSIARAVGPMAGGLLIAAAGLVAPWLGLALLYALALLFTFRLPRVEVAQGTSTSAWASLVDGVKYVRSHPIVSRVMLLAFSTLMGFAVMPIWPIYARDRFGFGGTGFGTMMAVFAVGQGLSALYVANRGQWKRLSVPILYGATTWSVMMVVFGFSTSYSVSLVALFFMGTAIPPYATSAMTILQSQTEQSMLGRVMAVYAMTVQVGMLGWLLGGWLGEVIGNESMLLLTGSSFAAINYLIFLTSRKMRQL